MKAYHAAARKDRRLCKYLAYVNIWPARTPTTQIARRDVTQPLARLSTDGSLFAPLLPHRHMQLLSFAPSAPARVALRSAAASRGRRTALRTSPVATASPLRGAELFVHPQYGRAVRATERIPAGTVLLKERPFFVALPSAAVVAEAAKASSHQPRANGMRMVAR